MIVRFLLGRAGAGKTHRCLDEIGRILQKEPVGPPLIFLVPEQATYQMDRALLELSGVRATTRSAVVSFKILAQRLLSTEGGLNRRTLTDLGRNMLVRTLLRRRQAELKFYHGESLKPGLVAHLDRTLHEFRLYGVEPEQLALGLESFANTALTDSLLVQKLRDLRLLYSEYTSRFDGELLDEADRYRMLCQAIGATSWLKNACLWVDSFSDFTKLEYDVLFALLRRVNEATFSLALDPADVVENPDRTRLFATAERTYATLRRRLPPEAKVRRVDLPEDGRFPRYAHPELVHLEAGLFPKVMCFDGADAPTRVSLVEASNRRAEVEACAREIQRLAREENYRYREMAVVVRDLEAYHDYFYASFTDRQIPFFIDQRRAVAHHPLVELLRAALRTVVEGWRHDTLIPYLKTGLIGVSRFDIDALENFALEHGIEGPAWYDEKPWSFRRQLCSHDEDCAEQAISEGLNDARLNATRALREFELNITRAQNDSKQLTVRQLATLLFQLLESLQADRGLERLRSAALERDRLDLAAEHVQVWDRVVELLDELVTALGEEQHTVVEFAEILESGLASLTLGLIPPGVDAVLVGSIDRSRQPAIKVFFLLGLSEGVFPLAAAENPILNDKDRQSLSEQKIELAPDSEQRFYQEQYLGYIAFTRASERVWVSYPKADERGRQLNPSPFVERLRIGFPGLKPVCVGTGADISQAQDVSDIQDLVAGLLCLPARANEFSGWRALYNEALSMEPARRLLDQGIQAWGYRNDAKLSPGVAQALFGSELDTSVSRLEQQAHCPFQHFVRHGLGLRPREEFRLEHVNLGRFSHEVLNYFYKKTKPANWADLDHHEAVAHVEAGVQELVKSLGNEILLTTARNRFISKQLSRMLKEFVGVLLRHAQATAFQPMASEIGFGTSDDLLPPLQLELGDGRALRLHGRIDRVDMAKKADGTSWLRVIDYKFGGKKLQLDGVLHGLSLQLLVYLLAAMRGAPQAWKIRDPKPAGAFFSVIKREIEKLKGSLEDASEESVSLEPFRLLGVFNEILWPLLDTTPDLPNRSLICKFYATQSGTLGYRNSSDAVSAQDLDLLLQAVKDHLTRLAKEILSGLISVAPSEHRSERPCTFCKFREVCRLEISLNRIRTYATKKNEDVLAMLKKPE